MKRVFRILIIVIAVSLTGCTEHRLDNPWMMECRKGGELVYKVLKKGSFSLHFHDDGVARIDADNCWFTYLKDYYKTEEELRR